MSKCRVCRGPAIIDLPRHNANFCAEHLQQLCRRQVEKAIADHSMLEPGDRVLVAVSGGKDSLAVWDLLVELGYETEGVYIGLGIGEYSDDSGRYAADFASARGLRLRTIDLRDEHGYDVPTAARATRRVPCSACGMSKRHLFDAAARDGGFDAVATGHNLDDEAAVLLGNTLHWDVDYLARQLPCLPATAGFPRKVKPLVRLTERETAAWCITRGIDYQVEECPMAAGNRHLGYKAALNGLEAGSPGRRRRSTSASWSAWRRCWSAGRGPPRRGCATCARCGAPTTTEVCAFCRLVEVAAAHEPVTVDMIARRGR